MTTGDEPFARVTPGGRDAMKSAAFFALIAGAISVAEPGSAPVLMKVDVPGLRAMESTHGRGIAAALADIALGRLGTVLGGNGFVCAQRDGQFAALIATDGSVGAAALGSAMLASLALPIAAQGIVLPVGATMGVAEWGKDGETAEELFVSADQAIYDAQNPVAPLPVPGPVPLNIRYVASPLRQRA